MQQELASLLSSFCVTFCVGRLIVVYIQDKEHFKDTLGTKKRWPLAVVVGVTPAHATAMASFTADSLRTTSSILEADTSMSAARRAARSIEFCRSSSMLAARRAARPIDMSVTMMSCLSAGQSGQNAC